MSDLKIGAKYKIWHRSGTPYLIGELRHKSNSDSLTFVSFNILKKLHWAVVCENLIEECWTIKELTDEDLFLELL